MYITKIKFNKKSPPAWTQEAYQPRHIKYYPRWGTPCQGTPSQVQWRVTEVGYPPQGTPQPGLMGRGYSRRGTSWLGSPIQVWWGVPKVGYPLSGTLLARSDGGTWGGVPPWGIPLARSWMGVPKVGYLPDQGTPPVRTAGGYPRWGTRSDGGLPRSVGSTQGGVPSHQGTPSQV